MAKDKVLQLAQCKEPIEAAVGFEVALGEVIGHYMTQGLSVSNAVGVLACVTSEITLSFNLQRGLVDQRIAGVVNAGPAGGTANG